MFTMSGAAVHTHSPGAEGPFPRVFALLSEWSGFVEDRDGVPDKWIFHVSLATPSTQALDARFIGTRMGDQFVTGLDAEEWTQVLPVGHPQAGNVLDRYERLHKLMVEQTAQPGGVVATYISP